MYRPLLCCAATLLAPCLCRVARPVLRELTRDTDGGRGAMSGDRLQSDGELFEQIFPQILQVLTQDGVEHPQTADAIHRLREVLEYNVPGGKRNRGLSVLASFRELTGPTLQTQENIHRVLIVGWCVEMLQAFFLVADDIMDQSITRRGRVCWYRKDGIGLDAINDSFLLEAAVYQLLLRYTKGQPYYLNLLELFLQTSYQTELGQALDLMTAPPGKVDLNRFTEQRYKAIVKYKTAYYSFYLPVAAAMYMAGIDGDEQHACAKSILLEMGEFFQIQDDYLDCYGDPGVTGKIGTDIEDNKCSWLVVQALQRVSTEQRHILEVSYGQSDPGKTARVKALYNELDLRGAYMQYEEQSYQRLRELITQHSITLPQDVFLQFAQKIYKREK